ncbi:2OG-Fe(II) oxygenase [Streptomyces sp. ODS28]|uniref:2OG-Fe(II) oxygenase n=1 Tax=Streptomyces sp. ODS28 TaxID=3136688 RepID=UPI0031E7B1ED
MAGYLRDPVEQVEISDFSPLVRRQPAEAVVPVPVCRFENALGDRAAEVLLSFCSEERDRFGPARLRDGAGGGPSDDCRFRMLPVRGEALGRHLAGCLPRVREALGLSAALTHADMALNAYGNGGYIGLHTDASKVPDPAHSVSAVYFLHRRPRAFTGGELRLYDTVVSDGRARRGGTYQVVEPVHDTLVFFPATAFHEVMPTACASGEFADSRFTLNMWVLGGPPPRDADAVARDSSRAVRWMAEAAAGARPAEAKGEAVPLPQLAFTG